MRLSTMGADSGMQKILMPVVSASLRTTRTWATKESIMTPTSRQTATYTARVPDRMEQEELAIVRRAYAKQIMVPYNAAHPRVEAAFAAVRREAFLGPGPWPIAYRRGYVMTPDDDPVYLYQDLLIGIITERRLNNGQPSGHAMLIARADPR